MVQQMLIHYTEECNCRSVRISMKIKDDYHKQLTRKLTSPKTSSKTYLSILKIF